MRKQSKSWHTDPHLVLHDSDLLAQFLSRSGIDPASDPESAILAKLCRAFARIPYENLTKIIKSGSVMSAGSAKRLPAEVIRDYLHYGAGGTCFSLTAAFIGLLNALGFEAHPILADRHYGPETHCALVFVQGAQLELLDPGYLIDTPTPLPTTAPVTVTHGFNTVELHPREAGRKVDLYTVIKRDRRQRLTYRVAPVDGATFGRAWERSFAWEMMTYPVLTRACDGVQYYLQGHTLRMRDQERTVKRTLTPEERFDLIHSAFGIHPQIIATALTALD